MVPQVSPAGVSISPEPYSAHGDAKLSNEQRCDSAPDSLAAVAKPRGIVEAGTDEWSDGPEVNNPGDPRPRWRRVLVPGSIVLLITALILFMLIFGSHREWWTL